MDQKRISRTYRLVLTALMIALGIILNRIIPGTQVFHLSPDFLPMFAVGVMFGPLWCAAAYGLVDLIACILFPYGPINPGITLSLMMLGLIYGLIFYNRDLSGRKMIFRTVAASCLTFLIKLFITTFFLFIMYGGKSYMAYVVLRLPDCIIMAVGNLLLLPVSYRLVIRRIRVK